MQGNFRIAAVVALYNPSADHLENIGTYSGEVDVVFAVDNSETPDPEIVRVIESLPGVVYVSNHGNQGIARAFNRAAELATEQGYDLLLTMDQDSTANREMMTALLSCLETVGADSVGIVSPCHQLGDDFSPPASGCDELEVAMASGNLLNLRAYRVAGPFRDDYFIDYVDHEYCLRLRSCGFRVVRANRAVLRHRLGAMTWHHLLWKRIKLGNHPPLRRYYAYRNRFHLHRQYRYAFPVYFKYFYREIVQELFSLLIFEQHKTAKLRMILRGYLDYRKGVFGKFGERV